QLGRGARQVIAAPLDGRADPGDDLDRRLQQLVLGLGVLAVRVVPAQQRQDLRRPAAELAGLPVDDLELDLHTEAGPFRGPEIDLHGGFPLSASVAGVIPAWIAHVEKRAGRNRLSERVSHICPRAGACLSGGPTRNTVWTFRQEEARRWG